MKTKKTHITKIRSKLGQNFLNDPKILNKIADAANITPEDIVVEIGPGLGSLTQILVKYAKKVVAIEKDESLVTNLKQKFKEEISQGKLEIKLADILEENISLDDYILIGNIPYYITGAIFEKFLSAEHQPRSMTFVVQKEVAERIIARPARPNSRSGGDNKESILSISVKAYGEPVYGGLIKAGSFNPAPKVDSAIISIRNISKKNFGDMNEETFFKLVKAGFAHKRKLLIRNLEELAPKERLPQIFDKLNIDRKIRAEDVNVETWFELAKAV